MLWLCVLGLPLGCGESGGGGAQPDLGGVTYATSECGTCVESACQSEWTACGADPGCAAWLSCVRACPTGPSGDADESCALACAAPPSGPSRTAAQALDGCRQRGQGSQCAACGHLPPADAGTTDDNPILNQQCPPAPPEDEGNACYTCEDTKCCDTYNACHDDPDCEALNTCAKGCLTGDDSDACLLACEQAAPKAAVEKYATRLACVLYRCTPDCTTRDACTDCQVTQCAEATLACQTNADCQLITDCGALCPTADDSCIDECVAMYPDGQAVYNAYIVCALARCQTECG